MALTVKLRAERWCVPVVYGRGDGRMGPEDHSQWGMRWGVIARREPEDPV